MWVQGLLSSVCAEDFRSQRLSVAGDRATEGPILRAPHCSGPVRDDRRGSGGFQRLLSLKVLSHVLVKCVDWF